LCSGKCLTASGTGPQGIDINLAPCTAGTALQRWTHDAKTNDIVLTDTPAACINLEGYGTAPGTTVWAYNPCTASDCKGNCDWEVYGSGLRNKGSGLCLDSRGPPPPPPPLPPVRTCAPDSIAASMPFCDQTKPMAERAAALVANLTMQEKLSTFMLTGQLDGIPRLNVKKFRWDATDIEGVDDQVFKFK
jgi:hypothetical protein